MKAAADVACPHLFAALLVAPLPVQTVAQLCKPLFLPAWAAGKMRRKFPGLCETFGDTSEGERARTTITCRKRKPGTEGVVERGVERGGRGRRSERVREKARERRTEGERER